jgi:hypothetical protein
MADDWLISTALPWRQSILIEDQWLFPDRFISETFAISQT